jgi:hypothetical protein
MPVKIPDPWLSFLRDVNRRLGQSVRVHCLGGFVLSVLWALPRPTGDVDFIEIEPSAAGDELLRIAGQGSDLAKLARNSPRDREDVAFLTRKGALNPILLEGRFDTELRPHVLNEARHAATLNLWLDEFFGAEGH